MIKTRKKLQKGGIDTIIAYIVVMIPLVYVLVFMIATLYHYTIQMSINQTVKETLVMASSYGTLTKSMDEHLVKKINKMLVKPGVRVQYFIRELDDNGNVQDLVQATFDDANNVITFNSRTDGKVATMEKGDLLGISVESVETSVLGSVSTFSVFQSATSTKQLKYSAYREEIIRNDAPDA